MKKHHILFRYSLLLFLANCCFLISAQAQNIVKAEYFLNTDPGFGLATNIPVTPAANIANLNFNVPIGTLPQGFHTLFTRVKDANGKWSLTNHKTFYKEVVNTTLPNIAKVEYFIDTDPGFGAGTNVPVPSGANLTNLAFAVNLASLQPGFHNLYTRAKDANGKWSITNVKTFYKEVVLASLPNVVKAEYFVDTDPGFGLATNIPLTPATDVVNLQFTINISSLPLGSHTLFVRAKDANGKWSITNKKVFNVCNGPAAPTVTAASRCDAGTVTLTASGANPGDYRWYANPTAVNPISGATAATFTTPSISATTTYYVSIVNGSCESPRTPVIATINASPAKPTISASGGVQTLTSSSPTGNQWHLNGTAIPGATGQTYNPTQTGTFTVVVTVNSCSTTSDPFIIAGTSESYSNELLAVYPNPNQGKFKIELTTLNASTAELKITDLAGKTILHKQVKAKNGNISESIELKKAQGIYLLQIRTENQNIIRKLIVE